MPAEHWRAAEEGTSRRAPARAPGAGSAVLTGAPIGDATRVACTSTRTFTGAGSARMICVPGARVQGMRRSRTVPIKLVVAFTPATGGARQTQSAGSVSLRRLKPIAGTG